MTSILIKNYIKSAIVLRELMLGWVVIEVLNPFNTTLFNYITFIAIALKKCKKKI